MARFSSIQGSGIPDIPPSTISEASAPKGSGKVTVHFLSKNGLSDLGSQNLVDIKIKEAKTPEKIHKYMNENRDYVLQYGENEFKFSESLQSKIQGKAINEIKIKNANGQVRVLKGSSVKIGTMTGEESRYLSQALEKILNQALEKKLMDENERIKSSTKFGKSKEKEAQTPASSDKPDPDSLYKEKRITVKSQTLKDSLANQSELEAWAKASREAREKEKENEREFNIRQIVQNSVKSYAQKKTREKEENRKGEIKQEPHPLTPEVKKSPRSKS
ncbi:hypothetical protein [Criblamydia sequanensis]|uniref:Uncharacterized protein n=1 Tax=Candidatus Criblamydia sequanensis CRIB-18 TaxID=1437425 RepID=A0A090CYZ1_9BACT|nr:hypothetical protein [Criblamydia sequanensis]CDR34032.1 hypothetical protein CSEC_1209 [Criblamydia sequanensis CRIB-18]